MYCRSPDCESCNPEDYCEEHDHFYRGYCYLCLDEED